MGNVCRNGSFDGMPVWTREDANTCVAGGGSVAPGGSGGGGSAATVAAYGAVTGSRLELEPLRQLRACYGETHEVALLDRLNRTAAAFTALAVWQDDELAAELVEGLARLARVATVVVDPEAEGVAYDGETHAYLSRLAERVAASSGDDGLATVVGDVIAAAGRYVDMSIEDVRGMLGKLPDRPDLDPTEVELPESITPPVDITITQFKNALALQNLAATLTSKVAPSVVEFVENLREATSAIDEKARSLGLAGAQTGDVEVVHGGYVRTFGGTDIYYSPRTGAHEVHGEIREKYDRVNGPVWLGLPTTDESGTPDGRGRYNHFAMGASIYWTPSTGPMIVRGAIRDLWARNGWERSAWGYPVQDEQRIPGLDPTDHPNLAWSAFENGMLFSQGPGAAEAVFAQATREEVSTTIRTTFDRGLRPRTYQIGHISVEARPGLYGVDFLGVDEWTHGFWGAAPRTLRLRIKGFVSLPIVSDPTFEIDVWLRFSAHWPSGFTYPTSKDVIVTLARYQARVNGVFSGEIKDALADAIKDAFGPDDRHPDLPPWSIFLGSVPTGVSQRGTGEINFLDIMLMADGSLRLYLNPLPPSIGEFRRLVAQNALANALETL